MLIRSRFAWRTPLITFTNNQLNEIPIQTPILNDSPCHRRRHFLSIEAVRIYKELYFPRKILKPEVDVNTYYYYCCCCCFCFCRWWYLLLSLLVLLLQVFFLQVLLTTASAYFITIYYEVRWSVITKCDNCFITKCDKCYYKVRQILQSVTILLQSATGITKCDDYYKVRQYNTYYIWAACGTASRSLHFMPPRTRDVCGAVPLLLLSLFAPDNDLISP